MGKVYIILFSMAFVFMAWHSKAKIKGCPLPPPVGHMIFWRFASQVYTISDGELGFIFTENIDLGRWYIFQIFLHEYGI